MGERETTATTHEWRLARNDTNKRPLLPALAHVMVLALTLTSWPLSHTQPTPHSGLSEPQPRANVPARTSWAPSNLSFPHLSLFLSRGLIHFSLAALTQAKHRLSLAAHTHTFPSLSISLACFVSLACFLAICSTHTLRHAPFLARNLSLAHAHTHVSQALVFSPSRSQSFRRTHTRPLPLLVDTRLSLLAMPRGNAFFSSNWSCSVAMTPPRERDTRGGLLIVQRQGCFYPAHTHKRAGAGCFSAPWLRARERAGCAKILPVHIRLFIRPLNSLILPGASRVLIPPKKNDAVWLPEWRDRTAWFTRGLSSGQAFLLQNI